jgi:hypothetical protein
MTGVRDHVALFYVALAGSIVLLNIAGFWTWNGWAQLGSMALVALVCTRVFAPVYFGWREREDYERR